MTNQQILKLLNEFKLEELKEKLIAEEAAKQTGGFKSQVNAIVSYLNKVRKKDRRKILGNYTEFENNVVFTNSYSMYYIKNEKMKLAIKTAINNTEGKYPDVSKILEANHITDTYVEINTKDIKQFIAETKANNDKKCAVFKFFREDANTGMKVQAGLSYDMVDDFMRIASPKNETIKWYYDAYNLYKAYYYEDDNMNIVLLPVKLSN